MLDAAQTPRPGEELATAPLAAYLAEVLPELQGPLEVAQFPAGFSNLTYLLRRGGQEIVLRRPPFGTKARTAHDMGREFRVLERLHEHFPYCPRPLFLCEDPEVLGAPFYGMRRIAGIILRRELPAALGLGPERFGSLCQRLLEVQLELHGLDIEACGFGDFGKPDGYTRRQLEGWSRRFRAAHTPDVPDCASVMAWLAERLPSEPPPALIHNDYKFDNVVLDPADPLRILGVLDWEMATVGNPLMDLGNSLAYWVQADDPEPQQQMRMLPTHAPGAPTRQELVERYAERSGRDVSDWDFYYCFGLFRLAGIAQQIYYRFYHGQTRDKRLKRFGHLIHCLEGAARAVIARS